MEIKQACAALSALAQESRLETFRLLVRAGTEGLAAGDIAETLGIANNTLSTHLGILVRGGLLTSQRQGRSIVYRVDFDGARSLLSFLLEDCCQANKKACGPALASVLPACCGSA